MTSQKINVANDYLQGTHPAILNRMVESNEMELTGYGTDPITASAVERIRQACACPKAEVRFLLGGTQTNQIAIACLLKSYQGVIAAKTGHVSVHEAGAIEFGGHKVLELDTPDGKLTADQIQQTIEDYWADGNHEHMVMPGMVYISQPTELGTLYSKEELTAISQVCKEQKVKLFVDGARLAYALACPENDTSLADIACLCDAFYIGGTKCGAMFGEALVIPDPSLIPHLTTIIKQHGALLAKGRLLGIQFDELFKDKLYDRIGQEAIHYANQIRQACKEAGLPLYFENPTNQVFCIVTEEEKEKIAKDVLFSFWEKYDDHHTVIRFATSWSTRAEDVEKLCQILSSFA
ncbi:threonine aldolase family protein [Streptococcus sp. DD13]|uniref:threonine aldolase family protein n=1 Tax=Streptococcus sp. DD13 TaxID=1777881 RepID=UPI0007922C81|nr:aminotransferase class I/II-fold pyridoxal phosphate-dependent enzyme [Streptococcus sp. DD13]KXT77583.1 Low-specificity L-threonine aldolase [Streptococcus sp. DD13]